MSNGERTVLNRDMQVIQLVQNLIKQCIQMDMNRTEVVNTLLLQAKIEPAITEVVWQKLEEENREFFEAYDIRLALKHHVLIFNELLKKQVALMSQFQSTGVSPLEVSNGSSMTQYDHNSGCFTEGTGESLKPDSLHAVMAPTLPHPFTNSVSRLHGNVQTSADVSTFSERVESVDAVANTLSAQNSDLRMTQEMSGGGMIKPESCYPPDSCFIFDSESHLLEPHPTTGETSIAPYENSGSGPQAIGLHDLPFELDMPRNFSLSDLAASYSRTDIMESYSRSPFLGSLSENFIPAQDLQEENKKLGSISEGLNYEDFGSQ